MSYYNNNSLGNGCLTIFALPIIGLVYLLKQIGKGILYLAGGFLGGIVYVPYALFIEPIVSWIKRESKPSKGCLIYFGIIIALFLFAILFSHK